MKFVNFIATVAVTLFLVSCNSGMYQNDKYGFSIDLSSAFQLDKVTDDSIVFVSTDRGASITVTWGNSDGSVTDVRSFREGYDKDVLRRSNKDVGQAFKGDYYFIAGYGGSSIYYQKTIVSGTNIVTAELRNYDSGKDVFSMEYIPVIESFKALLE